MRSVKIELPTIDEQMADWDLSEGPATTNSPFADADQAAVKEGYDEIMGRHFLALLRKEAGLTLAEVGDAAGVTGDAIRQTENRELEKVSLGRFVTQLQATGYNIDMSWLIRMVSENLPARTPIS